MRMPLWSAATATTTAPTFRALSEQAFLPNAMAAASALASSAAVKDEEMAESKSATASSPVAAPPPSPSDGSTSAPSSSPVPSPAGEPSAAAAAASAPLLAAAPQAAAGSPPPSPSSSSAVGGGAPAPAPSPSSSSAASVPLLPPTPGQVTALTSFAALLSAAQTNGVSHPLLNNGGEGGSLTKFLVEEDAATVALSSFRVGVEEPRHAGSFPTLALRNPGGPSCSSAADGNVVTLQDAAALNLANPLNVERQDMEKVPATLLKNCSASFLKLVDSRLRSSIAALLRQIAKLGTDDDGAAGGGGPGSEAGVVVKLLSRGNPVKVTTVVTSFRVVPSEGTRARGCRDRDGRTRRDLTLPLIFEAVVDANALGKLVTVALQAPGTITGSFHPREDDDDGDNKLSHVEVTFDTLALLKSMMDQARVVVKKAVSRAATVAAAASKAAKEKEEALRRALEEQRRKQAEAEAEEERRQRRERRQAQELLLAQQQLGLCAQTAAAVATADPSGTLGAAASLSVGSFGSLANALARHSSSEVFGRVRGPNEDDAAAAERVNQDSSSLAQRPPQDHQMTKENPFASQLDAFPQHLRETMAQLARENPPPPQPRQLQDRQRAGRAPAANDWLHQHRKQGGNDHEDNSADADGHCQPFTLSSLYEREDREKREAEEHAAQLRALTAASDASSGGCNSAGGGGGKKIELFSWLKGDSMLLSEEEDDLALHAAAAASAQQQQAHHQAQAPTPAAQALHLQQQQQQHQAMAAPPMQANFLDLQQQAAQLLRARQVQNEMEAALEKRQGELVKQEEQQQKQQRQLHAAHLQAMQNAQLLLNSQSLQRQMKQELELQQQQQAQAAVAAVQHQHQAHHQASQSLPHIPNLNLDLRRHQQQHQDAVAGLGLPPAFAAGRLPHTFSAMSASDMLGGGAGAGASGAGNVNPTSAGSSALSLAQQDEERRSSLPLLSSLGRSHDNASFSSLLKSVASVASTANLASSLAGVGVGADAMGAGAGAAGAIAGGGGRKRVSWHSESNSGSGAASAGAGGGRNESFDSSASSSKKLKKQVSFEAAASRRNEAFEV